MAAEGEARHLIGAAPAPFQHRQPAEATQAGPGGRRQPRRSPEKAFAGPGPSAKLENADGVQDHGGGRGGAHEAARGSTWTRAPAPRPWSSVPSPSPFSRPHQSRKVIPDLLDRELFERFEEDLYRSMMPSPAELAAENHRLVMECLSHYNLNHPENQYAPAPGEVTRHSSPHNGSCWTHGNFVASPKPSGCFSFLPAPRTLFFFELVTKNDFEGVVSCIPLDEPVTEAYSLLGLHLGWGTRRDGSSDCRCKTCNRLVDSRVPFVGKTFPCGHSKAECVCEMCYIHSNAASTARKNCVWQW